MNERPEIFNTDQENQLTSEAITGRLREEGIRISMDGKSSWHDNIFVERIWRSIKYEEVYLHTYASASEARQSIGRYIDFYNAARPRSSLKAQMPDQGYFNRLPESMAAQKQGLSLEKTTKTVRTTGTESSSSRQPLSHWATKGYANADTPDRRHTTPHRKTKRETAAK